MDQDLLRRKKTSYKTQWMARRDDELRRTRRKKRRRRMSCVHGGAAAAAAANKRMRYCRKKAIGGIGAKLGEFLPFLPRSLTGCPKKACRQIHSQPAARAPAAVRQGRVRVLTHGDNALWVLVS